MMGLGVIFAIISPAIYSIVNYFDKFFLEKLKLEPPVMAIFSGIIALLVSIILILIFGFHIFSFSVALAIIISGILTELYIFPYFQALSLEDASSVIPLAEFVPLFILIGDAFILGETLTVKQYIGAGLIIISGLLLSLERVNTYFIRPRKAFWYMMIAGMFIALATLFFKYGVGEQNFWYILPYEGIGIFIGSLLFLVNPTHYQLFVKRLKKLKKHVYSLMIINEMLFILARYCSFFALSFVSASMVGILAGIQPLFVLIYGVILSLWFPSILKEVITKKTLTMKIAAIVVIFIGIILISV